MDYAAVIANTDEDPEWAIQFGVQGIPTLLFIDNGEVFDRQVGAAPPPVIKSKAASSPHGVFQNRVASSRRVEVSAFTQ